VWIRLSDQESAPTFMITIRAGLVPAQVPAERPLPEVIRQPQVLPIRIVREVRKVQATEESKTPINLSRITGAYQPWIKPEYKALVFSHKSLRSLKNNELLLIVSTPI
jgi:hypothetical protein